MKIVSVPDDDIVTVARVIRIDHDEEEEWEGECGTYAIDSKSRVWKLDPTMTEVFQAFDLDEPKHTRKGH